MIVAARHSKATPRLATLLALLAAGSALAGCGSSKGGGEGGRGAKAESEAAPGAAIQAPEPGVESAPSRQTVEAASEQREMAELAVLRRRREKVERELEARATKPAHRTRTRTSHRTHTRTHVHKTARKKNPSTPGGSKNKDRTAAEQEARKRFEAEEAREAAEFKKQASKEN